MKHIAFFGLNNADKHVVFFSHLLCRILPVFDRSTIVIYVRGFLSKGKLTQEQSETDILNISRVV